MSVDPREILGVGPDAGAPEITAAYRRLAKRWHPDRANSPLAVDQMALLNAAYSALRQTDEAAATASRTGPHPDSSASRRGPNRTDDPRSRGDAFAANAPSPDEFAAHPPNPDDPRDSLADGLQRALGRELRATLEPGESVELVTTASTWASPQTVLAITDRRLLWLLDDVPVHRVRWLPLTAIERITIRPPRAWRRRAIVTCEDRRRRRLSFGELPPATAEAIVRRVQANRRPTVERRAG